MLSNFQPGIKILYLAGKHNVAPDALTRRELDIGLHPTSLSLSNILVVNSDLDS